MEVSVMDILDARETRASTQKRLLCRFGKPLICFTMNIAGPVKHSHLIEKGYLLGKHLLQTQLAAFPVLHFEESITATGCEGFYTVDAPADMLKELTVAIEDSAPVCRLFDMDVLDPDGHKLSREELGLPGRTCLICDAPAYVCSRSRTHSVAQLQEKTTKLLQTDHKAALIASLAYIALVQEVRTTPKPGLVDRQNSGSHRDMDIHTFLASAKALQPYFAEAALIGMQGLSPADTFRQLRKAGIAAEREMLAATNGINTHKGAIFTMGLLCAGAAMCEGADPAAILKKCAAMAKGLTAQDFAGLTDERAVTAGQKLYLKHGITGIRGQAEHGFPTVGYVGLPILQAGLQKGLSLNDTGCAALLHILCATEDTNLIARSDLDTARHVTEHIAALLEDTPYPAQDVLEALDKEFISKHLSPGGSADLLAATYFLHFLFVYRGIY